MLDYHIHTTLCRHAEGDMEEYLLEAERQGLCEIGFADHYPLEALGYTPRVQVTMDQHELGKYIEAVLRLRAASNKVAVKLGIEVDYLPGKEEQLREQLSRYPFDYIIGSVHFMDGWDFTHPIYAANYKDKDIDSLYSRYFQLVRQACESDLFDIIGHVDVIKKFGFRPQEPPEMLWAQTVRVLKQTNTTIELNTAGLDAPVGAFYPDRFFLELCLAEGVSVTLGSDAHAPHQVGRYFRTALEVLTETGFRRLSSFDKRRRSEIKLGVS